MITPWQKLGVLALQDHQKGVPVGMRKQTLAARIEFIADPDDPDGTHGCLIRLASEDDKGTIGDVHPWAYWQTAERTKRASGSYSMSWASLVVGGASGGFGGGGTTGTPLTAATVLPMRTRDLKSDPRFVQKSPGWPKAFNSLVRGLVMVTAPGTEETSQEDVLLHADPRIVAPNAGGPAEAGTLWVDCQPDGELCMDGASEPGIKGRAARTQSFARVIAIPEKGIGLLGSGRGNGVAWNLALSSIDRIAGYGMVWARVKTGGSVFSGGSGSPGGTVGQQPGGAGGDGGYVLGPEPGPRSDVGGRGATKRLGPAGESSGVFARPWTVTGPNGTRREIPSKPGSPSVIPPPKFRPGSGGTVGGNSGVLKSTIEGFGLLGGGGGGNYSPGGERPGGRLGSSGGGAAAFSRRVAGKLPGGGGGGPDPDPSGKGAGAGSGGSGGGAADDGAKTPDAFGRFSPRGFGGHGIGFCAHEGASGPITIGSGRADMHYIGDDRDGHPMTSSHIDCGGYFHDTPRRDGPLYFEGEYPRVTPAPIPRPVHLTWDPRLSHPFIGGTRPGMWRWWSEDDMVAPPTGRRVPRDVTSPPTPGGPGAPGPGTPRPGGPTTGGGPGTPVPGRPDTGGPPGGPITGGGTPGYSPGGPIFGPDGGPIIGDGRLPYGLNPGDPIFGPDGGPILGFGGGGGTDGGGGGATSIARVGADRGHLSRYSTLRPMASAFAAVMIRPQSWRLGATSYVHDGQLDADEAQRDERTRPHVLSSYAWGAESGSGWRYRVRPESSRVRGGSAFGGLLYCPPEFGMEDYLGFGPRSSEIHSPDGTRYLTHAPGVAVAWGTPSTSSDESLGFLSIRALQDPDTREWVVQQLDETGVWRDLIRAHHSTGAVGNKPRVTFSATSVYTYPHNLGSKPTVQVYNSAGQQIEVAVLHPDVNHVQLQFHGSLVDALMILG